MSSIIIVTVATYDHTHTTLFHLRLFSNDDDSDTIFSLCCCIHVFTDLENGTSATNATSDPKATDDKGPHHHHPERWEGNEKEPLIKK